MGWEEMILFSTTMPKRPERERQSYDDSCRWPGSLKIAVRGQFSVCEDSSEKVPSARDMLKER